MALANVLTIGATAADSADTVVAAATTFGLKATTGPGFPAGCYVDVMAKDDAGQYWPVGFLASPSPISIDLLPGTYLFRRKAGGACGVYSAA